MYKKLHLSIVTMITLICVFFSLWAVCAKTDIYAAEDSDSIQIELRFCDKQGSDITAPKLSENLFAYVEGTDHTRITKQLTLKDTSYVATVDGLLDQNGSKKDGNAYYPLKDGVKYTITLFFSKQNRNENERFDQNNMIAISDQTVLESSYQVTLPKEANLAKGTSYTANAKKFAEAGKDDFKSILGNSIDFGILAKTFNLLDKDAESNVAALVAECKTQTGNDLTNEVEQTFLFAEIKNKFHIKGFDAYVEVPESDAKKVEADNQDKLTISTAHCKDEIKAAVQEMIDYSQSQSELLATRDTNAAVSYDKNAQRYVLDLTNREDGTYYINLDKDSFQTLMSESGKLQIKKNDKQTVVFNVKKSQGGLSSLSESYELQKYAVNGKGSDSYTSKDAGATPQTIVWNFPTASSVKIAGSVAGIILAPQATVEVQATSSSWLQAETVNIESGEWHNVYQGIQPHRNFIKEKPSQEAKDEEETPKSEEKKEDKEEPKSEEKKEDPSEEASEDPKKDGPTEGVKEDGKQDDASTPKSDGKNSDPTPKTEDKKDDPAPKADKEDPKDDDSTPKADDKKDDPTPKADGEEPKKDDSTPKTEDKQDDPTPKADKEDPKDDDSTPKAEEDPKSDDEEPGVEDSEDEDSDKDSKTNKSSNSKNPKTGDETMVLLPIATTILAMAGICIAWILRRRMN